MAIVVATATRIGPGYVCYVSGISGPVPDDDRFTLCVKQTGATNCLAGAVQILHGNTFATMTIGTNDTGPLPSGIDVYVAPGASVDLIWTQSHHSGTVVDTGTVSSLIWDPTGGLGGLIAQLASGAPGDLAAVLAAVRKVKTTPGQV